MGFLHWLRQAFLFLLLLVIVPLAVAGLWLRVTVLNEDRYVDTVAPLAAEPAVQDEVVKRTMAYLDGLVVPDGGATGTSARNRLIQSTYQRSRGTIETTVRDLVGSDAFQELWVVVNRDAHGELKDLLTGDLPEGSDGAVRIDLQPVFDRAKSGLSAGGISLLDNVQPAPGDLTMTIFQAKDVQQARDYVRWFQIAVVVLVAAAAILALFYVWGARSTLLGIAGLCLIVAVGMAAIWVGLRIGRDVTVGGIADDGERAAAEAIYDGVVRQLRDRGALFAIGGLAAAVVFWLIQRSRPKPVYVR